MPSESLFLFHLLYIKPCYMEISDILQEKTVFTEIIFLKLKDYALDI